MRRRRSYPLYKIEFAQKAYVRALDAPVIAGRVYLNRTYTNLLQNRRKKWARVEASRRLVSILQQRIEGLKALLENHPFIKEYDAAN